MSTQVEFAWRVHDAQEAWTARTDIKAATIFTVQAALFAVVIAAKADVETFPSEQGWKSLATYLGLMLIAAGALVGGVVIFPRLGRRRIGQPRRLIYFGDLRCWEPTDLAATIGELEDRKQLEELCVQLVRLSKSNWIKFVLLRWSLLLTLGGSVVTAATLM